MTARLYFREPEAAVEAALDLTRTIADELGASIHVGAHAGPVVERDRDIFGRTVNLASRIADTAGPDEVMVSGAVVEAVAPDRFRFESVEAAQLKGVSEPIPLFRVSAIVDR